MAGSQPAPALSEQAAAGFEGAAAQSGLAIAGFRGGTAGLERVIVWFDTNFLVVGFGLLSLHGSVTHMCWGAWGGDFLICVSVPS
jgi:hypothetical protein